MSRPEFIPLPAEYRVRADMAAAIGGAVVFIISGFLFALRPTQPGSLTILALVAIVTAVGAAIAASDHFDDAINHQELMWRVRCGARTSGLGALLGAGGTVLGARVFGAQGSAIAAFVPSVLSILPSAFCGIIAAAIAAGVRLPRLPPTQRADSAPTGNGFIVLAAVASAAGFLSVFIPGQSVSRGANFLQQRFFGERTDPDRFQSQDLPSPTPETRSLEEVIRQRVASRNPDSSAFETSTATVLPQFQTSDTPSASPTIAAMPSTESSPPMTAGQAPVWNFPRLVNEAEPTYQMISSFIVQHHEKINKGMINALIDDYADQVAYFNRGRVDHAFIYRDEVTSHSRYRKYGEVILAPVVIREMTPGNFQAQYQITYSGLRKDNQAFASTSPVFLWISSTDHGLKITEQQNRSGDY